MNTLIQETGPIIDMHCHSTNSDGAQSPEEMYQKADELGIDIFAITDHDKITRHPEYPVGYHNGKLRLEGVEVSARYERGEYRKSLHIPVYALSLRGELEDILAGIRRGKAEKVQRQCEQLRANGCMIELPDGRIVPFSFEAMRTCFPDTQEDGFNNAHLVELLLRHKKNLRTLENIAPKITAENLLREGFKSEGKYRREISLREKLREYEPRIEELMEVVDKRNTIVSIAHPNYTFSTVEEFMIQARYILSLGLNAIEVNSTAKNEWIKGIETFRTSKIESHVPPIIFTYGSDCHDLSPKRVDTRHSLLGDMNPTINQEARVLSEMRLKNFFKTYSVGQENNLQFSKKSI